MFMYSEELTVKINFHYYLYTCVNTYLIFYILYKTHVQIDLPFSQKKLFPFEIK